MDLPEDGPFSRQGTWWLPERPDLQVAGDYVIEDDGGPSLRLIGALPVKPSTSLEATRVPVVLGQCEGVAITLQDCLVESDRFGSRDLRLQQLVATISFEGEHLDNQAAASFDNCMFTIPGIARWSGITLVEPYCHVDGPDEEWMYARWRASEVLKAQVPGGRIELVTATGTRASGFAGFTIEQATRLLFEASEPLAYQELWVRFVRPLRDFFTLAFDEPVATTGTTVWSTRRQPARRPGRVSSRVRVHASHLEQREWRSTFGMLFTRNDVDVALALARWFEIDSKASVALMLLAQARHEPAGWITTRFLSAVGAAESFHHSLHKAPGRPSLAQRLLALIEFTPASSQFITDRRGWCKAVADARNDLAHGNPGARDLARAFDHLYGLTTSLLGLLSLYLMKQLGFDDETAQTLTRHASGRWQVATSKIDYTRG
jgi:hypothetical protein